jgi:nucleotide-binding universal stress UspA family protein
MEKPSQVIVAYDFSPEGRAVLDRAIALAARARFHVLHFVTVIDGYAGVSAVPRDGAKVDYLYAERVREKLLEQIKQALTATQAAAEIHFFVHTRIGKPAGEILDLAHELGADLVLIGTHGFTGIERMLMGSVAEHVVREAGCPVLVVRAKTYPDVELMNVTEVAHKPSHWRQHHYSYSNNNVISRPAEWPLF